jgi:hypothetical protein
MGSPKLRRTPSEEPSKLPVFVARGTGTWPAWAAEFRRIKGKDPPIVERGGQTGWWFPSQFPQNGSSAAT